MPLADWTINGTGSYSIVSDLTSPGTETSVISITGELRFSDIDTGTLQNSRIESFIKAAGVSSGFGFFTNSTGFLINNNAPASFECQISVSGSNFVATIVDTSNGGTVVYAVATFAPLTGTVTDWQKWRFASFTSGGVNYLRLELWNGSAYIPQADVGVGTGTPTSPAGVTGYTGIITRANSGSCKYDDTKVYSLS